MPKVKEWYKAHSEDEKSFFINNIYGACGLFILMVIAFLVEDKHPDYNKAQNALFALTSMYIILIRRKGLVEIIRNTFTFTKKEKISINDISDIVFTASIVLVLISFLLVLDLKFITDNGIKIGGVVAVSLAGLLNSLRHTFKK